MIEITIDSLSWKSFPWNSKSELETYITDLCKEKSKLETFKFIDWNKTINIDEINSNVFLSEAFFGSFWESIIEAINDKGNNKTIINRIETRRQQATKIVSTQPFPKKRDYKLCSKLMETLSEEFFKNSVNHNNMPVIGWQKQTILHWKILK